MATPIRGQTRPLPIKVGLLETQKLNANLNASIHNRFDIEVIDATTGEIKQKAYAENVICTALWTKLFTPAAYFNYIHYGTGTGTPSSADTALFTFLGYGTPSTSDNVYSYDLDSGVLSLRRKIRLLEAVAVGSTLTEVGIGYSTASSSLCTHAMLKDMNGNQISINKTSTDIINIYATVFLHYNSGGYGSGAIKFIPVVETFGCTEKWLLGLYATDSYVAPLCYAIPSVGGDLTRYSDTYNTYQSTSACPFVLSSAAKTITITMSRLAAADSLSNGIGGIGSVAICDSWNVSNYPGTYPVIVMDVGGTWYSGTSIEGEAIGTGDGETSDFEFDFPFVQSGAKIYFDGIEQPTGFTIDENQPKNFLTNMGAYFKIIAMSKPNPPVPTSTGTYQASGGWAIYYNPHYALGLDSFYNNNCNVYASDDLETWVTISTSNATVSIPSGYKNYKYWKLVYRSSNCNCQAFTTSGITSSHLHFSSPPASGVVITSDYTTKTVAKDVNHVFDLSVVLTLGEYSA